jgi:hypothetical protein
VRLVLDAELEDPGRQAPRPGALYVIAVMRYRVLAVIEGEYAHDHVYVGHHWADLEAPEFQPGVRHRLELTTDFPDGATLLNEFDVSVEGVFYCTSFELLED